MKEFQKEFLNFVCTFDSLEAGRGFYYQLDKFLKEKGLVSGFTALSLPIEVKSSEISSKCRFKWNKDLQKEGISQDVLVKLLDQEIQGGVEETPYISEDKEVLFFAGKSAQQQYFVYLKLNDLPSENDFDLFSSFLLSHSRRVNKADQLRALESLVHVDDVTGLFNQRKLMKDLNEAISRHDNSKEEFSVVFIDIDHFKTVNDGHGHLVGTQLLFDMAKLLKKVCRDSDLLYRYGGDEFVLLVKDTTPEIALKVGHRILNSVSDNVFKVSAKDIHDEKQNATFKLTVSIGVAGFPHDAKSREDILSIADRMMYQAKESGRGRVCHAFALFEEEEKKA